MTSKKNYTLKATLIFFIAISAVLAIERSNIVALPADAMLLELVNKSKLAIDFAEIKHGNDNSQETIIALQIAPGSTRKIVLNHQPGKGFNLVILSGGKRLEVCVGKLSESRAIRQTYFSDGVLEEEDI